MSPPNVVIIVVVCSSREIILHVCGREKECWDIMLTAVAAVGWQIYTVIQLFMIYRVAQKVSALLEVIAEIQFV